MANMALSHHVVKPERPFRGRFNVCAIRRQPTRRFPAFLLLVASACFCLIAPGTGTRAQARSQTAAQRDALVQTFRAIDAAIEALGQSSSDYRTIVSNALAALPAGANDDLRSRMVTFLNRAPQPGPDLRCSADFLRARARAMLLGLRDSLLALGSMRTEPVVCYATPFALDSRKVQTASGSIEIFGFDFDASAPQLVMVTGDAPVDVTSALIARSHTHLTVDLSRVPLSSSSVSLELAWGHVIRHSIAVIQADTRVCSSRVERIPEGRMISDTLPRIGGDGTSAGGATRIWADASLDYSNNKLEATVCTTADQVGSDVVFSRCLVEFLYTTHPDRLIEGVIGSHHNYRSLTYESNRATGVRARGNGPVREWSFSGPPRSGAEISFSARLNEIRIVSTDNDRCISPISYLEAERTTGLSPATKQALEPQLRNVDSRIKTLRPRFAP